MPYMHQSVFAVGGLKWMSHRYSPFGAMSRRTVLNHADSLRFLAMRSRLEVPMGAPCADAPASDP